MVLLGDIGQVEACFGPFGDSPSIRAERTIGLEIILGTPNGTPR
jgi:hypothetical protein